MYARGGALGTLFTVRSVFLRAANMPSRTAIHLISSNTEEGGDRVYVVDSATVSAEVAAAFAVVVVNPHRHVRRPQLLLEVLLPRDHEVVEDIRLLHRVIGVLNDCPSTGLQLADGVFFLASDDDTPADFFLGAVENRAGERMEKKT